MIGFNPALAGAADVLASTTKGAIDYSTDEGIKTLGGVVGREKSTGEFAYDAGSDFVAGKLGEFGGEKLGKIAEGSVKKMIKAETKSVTEVARAANKFQKATKGGTKFESEAAKKAVKRLDVANSSASVARKNTVKAQMISATVKSPVGNAVNEGVQNKAVDKVKDKLGIK